MLVHFLELRAAPDRLPRAVLNAVVGALTRGRTPRWRRTPLYPLLDVLVRQALPAGKKSLTPAELDAIFRRQMAAAGGPPTARRRCP